MTQQRTKLELAWIGKENRPRLEPRILPRPSMVDQYERTSASAISPKSEYFDGSHTIHGVGTFEFLKKHLNGHG